MAFTYTEIDGQRVEVNVAASFRNMASDFQRDTGCSLHIASGTRTYDEQVDIFLSRYVTAGKVNGRYVYDTRTWNGTRYYRVSSAGTVAVPSTSNHEEDGPNGPRSIDIYDSGDDPGVTTFGTARDGWMQRNAGNYGFENEGNNFNEAWHKTFRGTIGGDGGGSGGGSASSFPARDLYGADWVVTAQQKLIRLGYNLGPDGADGYDGAITQACTKDVQGRVALPQDGTFGPDTNYRVDLLLSVVNGHKGFPLPPGYYFGPADGPAEFISGVYSYGPDLKVWQEQMKARGWDIEADGIYGTDTGNVAEAFQTEKGYDVDRKIGPQTWNGAWEAPITPPPTGGGDGGTSTPAGEGRNATLDDNSLIAARATKDIQAFLKVPQTGVWDKPTSDATAAFQRAEEIDEDRVWGITCDGLAFPPPNFGRLVDFSFARVPMDKLTRHNIVGVGRYLWNPLYDDGVRTNKGLSRAEAGGYDGAKIALFQIYEEDGKELVGGFAAGVAAARAAEAFRIAAGRPACAVYFNVDFDLPDDQMPEVLDALRGAASIIGLERVGLYAGYKVIKAAFDAGVIAWGFQTYAWSLDANRKIRWDSRAQLRQWSNGQWGDSVDFVWAMAKEYGQNPVTTKPNPDPDPKPEPGSGLTPEAASFWQALFTWLKNFFK